MSIIKKITVDIDKKGFVTGICLFCHDLEDEPLIFDYSEQPVSAISIKDTVYALIASKTKGKSHGIKTKNNTRVVKKKTKGR